MTLIIRIERIEFYLLCSSIGDKIGWTKPPIQRLNLEFLLCKKYKDNQSRKYDIKKINNAEMGHCFMNILKKPKEESHFGIKL